MQDKLRYIRMISIFLVLFYGVSLLEFCLKAGGTEFNSQDAIYMLLFMLAGSGAVGVLLMVEVCRKVLIVSNVAMIVYYFVNLIVLEMAPPISYLILNFVVILYFLQTNVRFQFRMKKKGAWRSILVVDDDESILKMIRPILISHGFSVLTASTGEAGLKIARAQHPDLIILDVILPGIKGREVCKKLKSDTVTKDIPVIFLTAKDSEDDIQAEIEAGAQKHITKPFQSKALVTIISEILDKE